jgi:hypothetical protein
LPELFLNWVMVIFHLNSCNLYRGGLNFYTGTGVKLDIMTSLKGVDLSFDKCLHMAPVAEIDGIMIPFLHINHLIDNKKSVNRLKDQIDVIELEKIKEIMAERESSNPGPVS